MAKVKNNKNSGGATPQYSTDETVIGRFKGKPLYSKVIDFSTTEEYISLEHNIGIERYVRHDVLLSIANYGNDLGNINQSNTTDGILINLSSNVFYMEYTSIAQYDAVVLEYTKTTD